MDERWDELLENYRHGRLTADQREEWRRLIEQRWTETPMNRPADHVDWETMYARIVGEDDEMINPRRVPSTEDESPAASRRIGWRIGHVAVAAVVIGLLGLGIWWVAGRGERRAIIPTVVQGPEHDVPPGGNNAVLTLAGGQRVVLDSVGLGQIAEQGGVSVQKTDSGRLLYASNAAAAGGAVMYNTLTIPRGGQYRLVLPDGTAVWLNSASSITYPTVFRGSERKVMLTGEAYFEVTAGTTPFRVAVDGMTVEVLGTRFNVNAYADEPRRTTTLLEGKIRVRKEGKGILIFPGEATIEEFSMLRVATGIDTAAAVAWRYGRFSFSDADVESVMRQLARWYDVDVRYEGTIPKRRFGGKIGMKLTLDQVLRVLTRSEIHYSIKGRVLTIRP